MENVAFVAPKPEQMDEKNLAAWERILKFLSLKLKLYIIVEILAKFLGDARS
jgi:hypothetical protein